MNLSLKILPVLEENMGDSCDGSLHGNLGTLVLSQLQDQLRNFLQYFPMVEGGGHE